MCKNRKMAFCPGHTGDGLLLRGFCRDQFQMLRPLLRAGYVCRHLGGQNDVGAEEPFPPGLCVRQPALCGGYPGARRPVLWPHRQPQHRHGPGHHGDERPDYAQLFLAAAPCCEAGDQPCLRRADAGGLCLWGQAGEPGDGPAAVHSLQLLRLLPHHPLCGAGRLYAQRDGPAPAAAAPGLVSATVLCHRDAEPAADLHHGAAHPGL